jgi:hypothetical protein
MKNKSASRPVGKSVSCRSEFENPSFQLLASSFLIPIAILMIFGMVMMPRSSAHAQTAPFYQNMKAALAEKATTSEPLIRANATGVQASPPAQGTSEQVAVTPLSNANTSSYGAYDAGRDTTSGNYAAAAAVLALIAVMLIVLIAFVGKKGEE